MSQIEIQEGLRRLEFFNQTPRKQQDSDQVLVEFVRKSPLGDGTVRVSLGRRGAMTRVVSGRATLIRTDELKGGATQYRYRIAGPIESHPD